MARMKSRKACLNCRRRHQKCDQEVLGCRRCRVANLTCDRSVHKFRHVSFEEQPTGEGLRPIRRVTQQDSEPQSLKPRPAGKAHSAVEPCVDESNGGGLPDTADSPDHDGARPSESANRPPSDLSPLAAYLFDNPPSVIGLPLSASIDHVGSEGLLQDASNASVDRNSTTAAQDSNFLDPFKLSIPDTFSLPDFNSPQDGPSDGQLIHDPAAKDSPDILPAISHPREAYLLKFFTQTWGPIFDCLDADFTFTKSGLHIALTFQPLFWAILATSALQLSRVSNYPFSAAKYYRSQCSKSLVPILLQKSQTEAGEEALFATYVMLRNYEHMTETLQGRDAGSLFTAALAIAASPPDAQKGLANLGRAAFWVHLRQDIHIALLLQVPINTDYPPCLQRDKIIEELDLVANDGASYRPQIVDCAWANQMAVLLAEIINYSFQNNVRHSESWIGLRGRLDLWRISKPDRFQPYYERPPNLDEGRCFPDIWLSSDCYVLAWLYYHTATVLLKTYPPNLDKTSNTDNNPTLGNFENREEVLVHARAICGIVMTNPNAQALIVFCHMVTVSAIFLIEKAEQNETIAILRLAHSVTGHPMRNIEQKLWKNWNRDIAII